MRRSVLGYAFFALLLGAPVALAQDGGNGGGGGGGGDQGGRGQRPQRKPLVEQLKDAGITLTDDQATKIKAIDDQVTADISKAYQDAGQDRQARTAAMTKIFDKRNTDIKAVLTDEQKPKFDEFVKKEAERRQQRGGQGGGRGQDNGPPATPANKPEKEIMLGQGGFDYLKADAASRKLYVAHSTKVDVIDMDKGEKIGQVDGVEGSHGTAIAPELKRGFATAGRKQKVIVFDTDTNKVIKEVDTGRGPDAIIFASSVNEAWSINHQAGSITCIDAKSLEVTKTIDVGGTLEFAAEDPAKGMVYVNVESKSTVVAIDAKKHEVQATWPTAPGEEPTGVSIDAKNGLLFVGCGNKKLVVINTADGKVASSFDIGDHCDAVAFDEGTLCAFASCGDGTTNVIHEKDAKTFEALKPIGTARGGKCCTVDPKTHKLYVAVAPRGRGGDNQAESKVMVFATEVPASATPGATSPQSSKTYYNQ